MMLVEESNMDKAICNSEARRANSWPRLAVVAMSTRKDHGVGQTPLCSSEILTSVNTFMQFWNQAFISSALASSLIPWRTALPLVPFISRLVVHSRQDLQPFYPAEWKERRLAIESGKAAL